MMWSGKQRPAVTKALACALVGLMMVSLVLLFGIGLWEGWFSKPLGVLPTLFWMLYTPMLVILVILLVAVSVTPRINTNYRNGILSPVVTNAMSALFGAMLTVNNLFMPTWTGGRLLGLTVGILLLIQNAGELVRFYIARRRNAS